MLVTPGLAENLSARQPIYERNDTRGAEERGAPLFGSPTELVDDLRASGEGC